MATFDKKNRIFMESKKSGEISAKSFIEDDWPEIGYMRLEPMSEILKEEYLENNSLETIWNDKINGKISASLLLEKMGINLGEEIEKLNENTHN